jgi:drug/metabolite transporter (DMT)-like permease
MQKREHVTARRIDARAASILLACCAAWGFNQVAIKVANQGISPMLQAGLRSAIAGVIVLAWAFARRIPLFERDGSLWGGIAAGLLFGAEFMLLYVGLEYTTASRGILFLYLAPFAVAVGAHFFVPGDRLTWTKVAGLLAALIGLAVAMGEGVLAPERPTLLGDLLSIAAAVMWGATTVVVRASALRFVSTEKTLIYQLAVSAAALPVASWLMGEPGIVDLSPPVLIGFGYTVLVVAMLSYLAWFWLVRTYPPTRLASFTFLSPVFGVAAGRAVLGEEPTLGLAAALVLVAAGIWLVNRSTDLRLVRTGNSGDTRGNDPH